MPRVKKQTSRSPVLLPFKCLLMASICFLSRMGSTNSMVADALVESAISDGPLLLSLLSVSRSVCWFLLKFPSGLEPQQLVVNRRTRHK